MAVGGSATLMAWSSDATLAFTAAAFGAALSFTAASFGTARILLAATFVASLAHTAMALG